MLAGIGGLLGATGPALAGRKLQEQRKDGTLEHPSPVDQAISAIQATVDQVQSASADLDRVKDAVSNVFGSLPIVGPLAQQVIRQVDIRQ